MRGGKGGRAREHAREGRRQHAVTVASRQIVHAAEHRHARENGRESFHAAGAADNRARQESARTASR